MAANENPVTWQCDILLELMATVAVRLARLQAAEPSRRRQARYDKARDLVLDQRFQFDPDDAAQVSKLIARHDWFAGLLAARLSRQSATSVSGS
ncbi:hypothetical protein [Azohydromonas australica]|uniref:hypothetical protein n=1 Tax=Azohydromonas australica TaxID=364039 RepID=UPI0003F817D1|nr:hypothetical protein [Azohydromonas australica]